MQWTSQQCSLETFSFFTCISVGWGKLVIVVSGIHIFPERHISYSEYDSSEVYCYSIQTSSLRKSNEAVRFISFHQSSAFLSIKRSWVSSTYTNSIQCAVSQMSVVSQLTRSLCPEAGDDVRWCEMFVRFPADAEPSSLCSLLSAKRLHPAHKTPEVKLTNRCFRFHGTADIPSVLKIRSALSANVSHHYYEISAQLMCWVILCLLCLLKKVCNQSFVLYPSAPVDDGKCSRSNTISWKWPSCVWLCWCWKVKGLRIDAGHFVLCGQ